MACGLGSGAELIEHLRGALADFTGPGWEQEDDVTFVTVERMDRAEATPPAESAGGARRTGSGAARVLAASRSPACRTTSARRWSRSEQLWRDWTCARLPRAAEDRGGRGDDERHGARQSLRSRDAGGHPGARTTTS